MINEIKSYTEEKKKEIDEKAREIENRLLQMTVNIEATLNEQPLTNDIINREVKKMIIREIEKAFR